MSHDTSQDSRISELHSFRSLVQSSVCRTCRYLRLWILPRRSSVFHGTARHFSKAFLVNGNGNFLRGWRCSGMQRILSKNVVILTTRSPHRISFSSLFIFTLPRRPLGLLHPRVPKSESLGGDANLRESDEGNAIGNPTAARLCRWPEGAEEEYQERILVFSVITRAAGIRTRASF